MPTIWECEFCHLSFMVGWYHYHDFSRGYAAKTHLVCKYCGTMHAIEHAITLGVRAKAEDSVTVMDHPPEQQPDRLLSQPEPLFVDIDRRERAAKTDKYLDLVIETIPKLRN